MKETIILSNLNGKELLKSISLNGRVSFNTRILNAHKLASEVLLRHGVSLKGELINSFRQECIIYNLACSIPYFEKVNFADCKNIVSQLNIARLLTRGNETEKLETVFSSGEFIEKNKAILDLYYKYKKYLDDNNLYDYITIINKVINGKYSLDCEFIYFKEDSIYPLEEELIKTISNNNYNEISLVDYLGLGLKDFKECDYDESYGAVNEVENIIGYISKEKIKYDDVLIVLNDSSYFSHFLNLSKLHFIPMTFSQGYSISMSSGASILKLIGQWEKEYNSYNPLLQMINSPDFNSELLWSLVSDEVLSNKDKSNVLEAVGSLRICANKNINESIIKEYKSSNVSEKLFNLVSRFADEFSKGFSYLISTYTNIRKEYENLDTLALKTICNTIDEFMNSIENGTLDDVQEIIMSKNVIRELSAPGSICVCNLKDALVINRKHIFISGLGAKNFPGSPKENYLLLDSDLELFSEENIPTSQNIIKAKKQLLFDVLDIANALNSKIHISYSGYSLTDLKVENPSSLIFEIFKKEKGNNATLKDLSKKVGRQHSYFDEDISINKNIGKKYIEGLDIIPSEVSKEILKEYISKNKISPSAAEKFFECPKKYYLKYILGVNEPDEDDPFSLMPGGTLGTLVHECMEDLGENPLWSEKEFLDNAIKKFDNHIKQRRTVHTNNHEKIKREYLDIALEGYHSDPRNIVVSSEEELGPIRHESGLTFGGRTDRIEKLEDGSYVIVDYKTYGKIKQSNEDIDTCFQVMLYSWLLNKQKGVEVRQGEYRYLKVPGTYSITFNELNIERLNKKIFEMKQAFDKGEFVCKPSEENCKYCKYINICGLDEYVKQDEEKEVNE